MKVYLNALRLLGVELNAPARSGALRTMERMLGFPLLDDLRTLYRDHGGIRRCSGLPMRLMPPSEVTSTVRAVRRNFPDMLDEGAGLFWTDDNSNYAGVFLAPPLRGRVFFLNHEEPDDAPRFRSLESFCRSMLAAVARNRSWFDMETDYPRLTDPADIEGDEDRAIAIGCLRESCGGAFSGGVFPACASRLELAASARLRACAATARLHGYVGAGTRLQGDWSLAMR